MPLLDHFHPPLSDRRPFESFHTTWASALADHLTRDLAPHGYIALEQVHAGAAVEIDVATYGDSSGSYPTTDSGGTVTAPRTVWVPATAPLVLPAVFPPGCTIEIRTVDGSRTLVAALELVSPANKDRANKRRLFAAKCATYLSRGIGLIIVDVVTNRQGNLHNEVVELLGLDAAFQMASVETLYSVAYRPLRVEGVGRIETWPVRLQVGDPLPTLPLSLEAEFCVPVDLEAAYTDACQRRWIGGGNGQPS